MEHERSVSNEATKESEASQVDLDEEMNKYPKLGLKLSITPSLIDDVKQVVLNSTGCSSNSNDAAVTETMSSDNIVQRPRKQKAESFFISLLQIGSWQRVSRNEVDLVAKCYFFKRKLAWEFLEVDGLKRKIEIQWNDILSLRALVLEGPGVLEIELTGPPTFYHEIEPKPRKHTQWRVVQDFTGEQASTYRRHYLEFPPGALNRPLEKILKSDNRLFQMSQQGYPVLKSPYFTKFAFRDSSLLNINPQPPLPFGNIPTYYPTFDPAASLNQMPLFEGQGGSIINTAGDNLIAGGTTMMPSNAAATTSLQQVNSSTMSFDNTCLPLSTPNQLQGLVPMQQPSMMFQTDHDNLFMQGHLTNNMTNDVLSPTMMADNDVLMNNAFSNTGGVGGGGGQMYPDQVTNWPFDDHPFSSISVNPPDDFNHEINSWTHDFNPPWQ